MSNRIERVVAALEAKLEEAKNNQEWSVELKMKVNGDRVEFEPWINPSFSVWFAKYQVSATAKDIETLAQWLIEYPKEPERIVAEESAWVEENEPKLKAYFNKYFAGKTSQQINAEQEELNRAYESGLRGDDLPQVGDWGWYSDWHKDVYGYRPHAIVCGEYVSPY